MLFSDRAEGKHGVDDILTAYAKRMRRGQTKAETRLWSCLRAGRFSKIKFRRQYVIADYIVDFYCAKGKLAIEIDGDEHYSQEHQEYGSSHWIPGELWFCDTNREVICETDRVLADIFRNIVLRRDARE